MDPMVSDAKKIALDHRYIIALGVLLLVILAIYFISRQAGAPEEKIRQTQEQINKSLEVASDSTKVEVPSVNPLGSAVPDVNPIEKANPFKGLYENPFE